MSADDDPPADPPAPLLLPPAPPPPPREPRMRATRGSFMYCPARKRPPADEKRQMQIQGARGERKRKKVEQREERRPLIGDVTEPHTETQHLPHSLIRPSHAPMDPIPRTTQPARRNRTDRLDSQPVSQSASPASQPQFRREPSRRVLLHTFIAAPKPLALMSSAMSLNSGSSPSLD